MVLFKDSVGECDCDSSACVADTVWVRGKWRRAARSIGYDKSFVESDNETATVVKG